MIRLASQLLFCSPSEILWGVVVERDDLNIITRIFRVDENLAESAQTLFFDGIISGEIVSLKQNVSNEDLTYKIRDYNYVDLSSRVSDIKRTDKPLILDFGTDSFDEINSRLSACAAALADISMFDLIAACVFYPALAIQRNADLAVGRQTELLLWENSDLLNKRFTQAVRVRKI